MSPGRRRRRDADTDREETGGGPDPMVTAVTAVADRLALSQLVDRYAALVDERDYRGLTELFTVDAVLFQPRPPELLRPEHQVRGRAEIAENFRLLDRVGPTQHAIVGQVFATDPHHPADPDRAAGRIAAIAHHLITGSDGTVTDHAWHLTYRDRYIRDGARWLFAERIVDLGWVERRPVAMVAEP